MKLSFSTLGCPKLDFKDTLAIAKDMGYNGIEIRGIGRTIDAPNIKEFFLEQIQTTKAIFETMGLEVPIFSSACYLHLKELWERENYALAKRYVDTASLMGTSYIRVLGDKDPAPDGETDDELVVSNLAMIADYAKEKNVTVLIETNGDLAKSDRLLAIIERVGRENVGVVWDIHHPYRFFGEEPSYTFGLLGKYIKHVHIKDSEQVEAGFHYELPGYGDIPIKKSVEVLLNNGYEGYFSLEWVKRWDSTLEEPGIVFSNYVHYMKRWV